MSIITTTKQDAQSKMLSELSDRENRIYTILDIDTMEQAISISNTNGLQLNGPTRQEQKPVTCDIIEISKTLKDI